MLSSCFRGRGLHGFHDVLIPRASAEIAFQAVPDFSFRGIGISVKDLLGGHDHAGRAEAALKAVVIPEGLLDRMKGTVASESFDSDKLAAIGLDGEHRA
jgi:hypothetical protein